MGIRSTKGSKSLTYLVKGRGEPCKQGQTAASIGCIPKAPQVGKSPFSRSNGSRSDNGKAKKGKPLTNDLPNKIAYLQDLTDDLEYAIANGSEEQAGEALNDIFDGYKSEGDLDLLKSVLGVGKDKDGSDDWDGWVKDQIARYAESSSPNNGASGSSSSAESSNSFSDSSSQGNISLPKTQPPDEVKTRPPAEGTKKEANKPVIRETYTPNPGSKRDRLAKESTSHVKRLSGGCNVTELLTLEDGTKAVFKSAGGEEPGLREGVQAGTYYRREVAASLAADILGFGDLVPTTSFREEHGSRGSIQEYVDGAGIAMDVDKSKRYDGDEDCARASIFDYIVGHMDRHFGNWLVKGGKLSLIDNGLSFPTKYDENDLWNCMIHRNATNEKLPIPDVSHMRGKWPELAKALKEAGVEDEAISLTKDRFDYVVDGGYDTIGELPNPFDEDPDETMADWARMH